MMRKNRLFSIDVRNHGPDEENTIKRQTISDGLQRKAVENISERPLKLQHLYNIIHDNIVLTNS